MSIVLRRIEEFWHHLTDDDCLDIPLTDVNQLNILGEQPIHIAAWKCGPEEIEWLVKNGADVNSLGDFGMTPLHYAYMGRKLENVATLLRAGANADIKCDRGLLPGDGYK